MLESIMKFVEEKCWWLCVILKGTIKKKLFLLLISLVGGLTKEWEKNEINAKYTT